VRAGAAENAFNRAVEGILRGARAHESK